jgi:hypothetical protein
MGLLIGFWGIFLQSFESRPMQLPSKSLLGRALLLLTLSLPLLAQGNEVQLPSGFEVRRQIQKVGRIPKEDLPWQVYSADQRFQPAVVHALNSWNALGRQIGVGLIYEIANTPDSADLIIDWSGAGLPKERASAVWWDVSFGRLRVTGLTMDGRMNVPIGNFSQLLMHELGHPLGLDHSQVQTDIMYTQMHKKLYRRYDEPRLSSRDVAALTWLYAQGDFLPIGGVRKRAAALVPKDPAEKPSRSVPSAAAAKPVARDVYAWTDAQGNPVIVMGLRLERARSVSEIKQLRPMYSKSSFEEKLQTLAGDSRLVWHSQLAAATPNPKGKQEALTLWRPSADQWSYLKSIAEARAIRLELLP